jgi:hypothetical protein
MSVVNFTRKEKHVISIILEMFLYYEVIVLRI